MKKILVSFLFIINLFSAKINDFTGKNAIDFVLPTLSGERVSLESLRYSNGKVNTVILVFFDTECQPCIKELPTLKKIFDEYKGKEVILRMVSVGEDEKKVNEFIKRFNLQIPVLLDKSTIIAEKYGVIEGSVKKIPQVFVIGKEGKFIKHLRGFHEDLFKILSDVIDKELKRNVSIVKKDEIEVLYTSSASGNIISCDCPTQPFGGLDRCLSFIKRERKANTLVFDTGDFFSPYDNKLKNEFVLKFIERINYDAVVIGDQEFASGVDFFIDKISNYRIPIVLGNLQICGENSCFVLGKPYIIKEINGVRIAITGVISEKTFFLFPKEIKEKLKFTNTPEEFLNEIIPELRKKADFIFVLSHQGDYPDRELAKKVKGIDVIFGGHSQSKIDEKVGNTIILQPGEKGMYVGRVIFKIKNKKIVSYRNKLIPLTKDIKILKEAEKLVKEFTTEEKKLLKKLKK